MGPDLRAVMIAHLLQHMAGPGICKDRMGTEQRQRKAQIPAQRREPGQEGNVGNATTAGGIMAGKQAFFFDIETDDHPQGLSDVWGWGYS